MRRFIAALFAFSLLAAPAQATPPVFNGDVFSPTTPVFNVVNYGANPANSDNTTAFNNAIAAAAAKGGGVVFVPCSTTAYIILGALTVPYSGTNPAQSPIRIMGCGPAWNSDLIGDITPTGSVLDMRYDGTDGQHPAKIDLRGRGYFEIDHLTLEDTGTDSLKFGWTTNTAVYAHDNVYIGNTHNSGTSVTQDAWQMGGDGYWGYNVNTTNGSKTLTCSDCSFTAGMVGWTIYYSAAGQIDAGAGTSVQGTISAVNSSTSITLASAATSTITGGEANYFGTGTSDVQAPYQGYTSRFVHNLYTHICSSIVFGNYANGIRAEDELFGFTSGCASSITNGAWYRFDKASSLRLDDVINGAQGEIQNYPFVISAVNDVKQSVFENISPDDASITTIGGVYFGQNVIHNRVTTAAWVPYKNTPTIDTTIATGFSSGTQTVTVGSITGISTSTPLLIDPDGSGVQEWVTPSSVNSGASTFTATFAYAHGNNIRVLGYGPVMAGPAWQQNALWSNGENGGGSFFPSKTTLGGTYPNQGKIVINSVLQFPNSTVNQGFNSTAISDGGTVSGQLNNNAFISFGSLGAYTSPSYPVCYGNGSPTNTYSCLGSSSLTVAGVPGSLMALFNTGTLDFTFSTAGDFSAIGNVNANGKLVAWGTGQNLILGNGAGGNNSYIKMSNASGATNQYSFVGNGTGQFGATCGGVAPTVFAVQGQGGTVSLCTDQNGNTGTNGTWNAPSGSATSCTGGYKFATSGVMVISGAGAPTCTAPAGSMYLRTDGTSGARLYISAGSGTWNPVAGV